MIVFEWLNNWFEDNKPALKEREITFSFSKLITDTDKPSQYVDIDTQTKMARVSLWETGECDFEIIKNETGENIFWENRIIKSTDELAAFLHYGFSRL